jgi:hypothetical protein
VRKVPGVEAVTEIRAAQAKRNGNLVKASGVDASLAKVVPIKWKRGSDSVPAHLGGDGAFVSDRYADDHSLSVGSPLTLTTPTGKTLRLRLRGIFDRPPRTARGSSRRSMPSRPRRSRRGMSSETVS